MKIRKNDNVMVIAGKDTGKKGNVARVLPKTAQVVVEGMNIVKKHAKPNQKKPKGGITGIAKPLDVSNVAVICPHCKKPTRIGYKVTSGGDKERTCKKCGNALTKK